MLVIYNAHYKGFWGQYSYWYLSNMRLLLARVGSAKDMRNPKIFSLRIGVAPCLGEIDRWNVA